MRVIAERRVDELGRVVIPREMRERHRIVAGSTVRILEDADGIVLEPDMTLCRLCGAPLPDEGEYLLCEECLNDIRRESGRTPKIVPLFFGEKGHGERARTPFGNPCPNARKDES